MWSVCCVFFLLDDDVGYGEYVYQYFQYGQEDVLWQVEYLVYVQCVDLVVEGIVVVVVLWQLVVMDIVGGGVDQ